MPKSKSKAKSAPETKSVPETNSAPERQSLTTHLLSLQTDPPYGAATQHPFLTSAGTSKLPEDRLALWLAQDRVYCSHLYPRFIGTLISRIPFNPGHSLSSNEEEANHKILKVLVYCLESVILETSFFKEMTEKWKLDLGCWKERKATRDIMAEMVRIPTEGLPSALVFLWAMEKIDLDAWTYVQSQLKVNSLSDDTAISVFSDGWSSPEYVQFVDKMGAFVDGMGIKPGSAQWKRAEDIGAESSNLRLNIGLRREKRKR